MRVLFLHNRYQRAGGEDTMVANERALLQRHGHEAPLLEVTNDVIQGRWAMVRAGVGAVYSLGAKRHVARAIAELRPELVHVHNFFPLLSPSVYDACTAAGVPVVQTLHNYRLVCANALLYRDGHVCEDCLDRGLPWPGVVHGCYRESRLQTASVAAMATVHRLRGTWDHAVSAYIALTEFQKRVLVRGGLPAARIHVKPNCVPDAAVAADGPGAYAIYVGRLSPEKGVATLLEAYEAGALPVPLQIVGDGPLRAELERRAQACGASDRITFAGWRAKPEIARLIAGARFVVCPSQVYECGPLAVAEAFAGGRPVVATARGAFQELVEDGATGWLVDGGGAAWRAALIAAWARPDEAMRRGRAVRRRYEQHLSEAAGYARQLAIYDAVLTAARPALPVRPAAGGMHVLICALSRFFQPTGICRHAANLALALADCPQVARVTLAVGDWQEHYFVDYLNVRSAKIDILPVPIRNDSLTRNAWFAAGLPRLARRLEADVVQVSFPVPLVRERFAMPVVTTVHDLYPYDFPEGYGPLSRFFKRRFVERAIRNSDGLAAVSHATVEALRRRFPAECAGKAVQVVANYANCDPPEPRRPAQVAPGSRFLLCVGQHQKNKRIDLLLRAFQLLRRDRRIDDAIELFVAGSPGSQTEALVQLSRDLGLEPAVHWLPALSDAELAWLYDRCELFVVSSATEGFCLPLVEALRFSCRVVCSDIPILHEVGDESCTYFALEGDAAAHLAEAMAAALARPRPTGGGGDRYSKAATASQTLQLYASLDAVRRLDAAPLTS